MKWVLVVMLVLSVVAPCTFAQPQDEPSIIVAGRIERKRLTVTAGDIGKLPKRTVQVKTEKATATFEGVALHDVLELAGVLFGQKLTGARLMAFIVVEGAPPPVEPSVEQGGDDYRALFSLPELDTSFTDQPPILLAITRNGKPLDNLEGPYRIIVPGDKRSNRWVKDVKMIYVLHADTILGFGAGR